MTAQLLVELLCEELPPKALQRLSDALASGLAERLVAAGFAASDARIEAFATPRRLAVRIAGVKSRSPDTARSDKLLPVSIGLAADGSATAPLVKKLAALGLGPEAAPGLRRVGEGKNESLWYDYTAPGRELDTALGELLQGALDALPVVKVMTYQLADLSSVRFVRPVHRLVALLGADIVPVRVLGIDAGRTTLDHHFLSSGDVTIVDAASYAAALLAAKVVVSFEARRAAIVAGLEAAAGTDSPVRPRALLDEVTAIVEWPVVRAADFEARFLDVPQECLILTMQLNQKYFALTGADGALRNRFLLVSNLEAADPARIVEGNQRVLRARLADAQFFYDTDRKQPLIARLAALEQITYHNKLGSVRARVARIETLASSIAGVLGADAAQTRRAALLSKCDLVTGMVGEFPELQGVMGAYYARHDGEPAAVAHAIAIQYRPRIDAAALGADPGVAASVYLADRIEALVGIWGIGLAPTGEKDPYALRRAALGVIDALQALGARAAEIDLSALLAAAESTFAPGAIAAGTVAAVIDFIYERARHLLAADHERATVDAVIAVRPAFHDIAPRVAAVTAFRALPEAEALAAANKRIGNILRKNAGEAGAAQRAPVSDALISEPAERALADALSGVRPGSSARYDAGDYTAALQALARLRAPVDAFFDDVMVMADDPAVRANRIALLADLHGLMNRVADLSRLAA
ncbi:glycine--tRNA ligase subunit beta [soil metagenome]